MKISFYPSLAIDGMRKNKQLYLPYIFTCIGMTLMYYIIKALSVNPNLDHIHGGSQLKSYLEFGAIIIAIFAFIFLFYSNSFLIKRRKKEFGLYQILGMNRKNIGRILFYETLFVYVFSTIIGVVLGVILSKLAELGLFKIMNTEPQYSFFVSIDAIIYSFIVFFVIFLFLYIKTRISIRKNSTIDLLHSENFGEKPLKSNYLFAILGIIFLGAGYYIAIKVDDPISAILYFFIAVIFVIIGTYLVLISTSVMLCKLLKKNKKYYYKANHFVSVSSMGYRMKRNGAGLASICILATMVLVLISSTFSTYFGANDAINRRFPREVVSEFRFATADGKNWADELRDTVNNTFENHVYNSIDYFCASVSGMIENNKVILDHNDIEGTMSLNSGVYTFKFIPLDFYNEQTGKNIILNDDEVLIASDTKYKYDTINLADKLTLKVKDNATKEFFVEDYETVVKNMYIIVKDFDVIKPLDDIFVENNIKALEYTWIYDFDTKLPEDKQNEIVSKLHTNIENNKELVNEFTYYSIQSKCYQRDGYFATFGSLMYIGLVLSFVFMVGTVLIIYYKQISEGFEDQKRFEIMSNIGMSNKEIKRSINSQLLTIFFIPLIGAALHITFAFPMIEKILKLFYLYNIKLFAIVTITSFLIFVIIYIIVYKITSNVYYKIVARHK